MQPLGLGCLGLLFCTRALTLLLLAAGVLLGKLHFSYAGMTCYYAFLVGESLLESSDRAVARASSLPRQPFKGQLNASRAQSDSKDPIKNKDFHQSSKPASSSLYSHATTIKTAVAVPAALAVAAAGRKRGLSLLLQRLENFLSGTVEAVVPPPKTRPLFLSSH